jgi:hypothetical protein
MTWLREFTETQRALQAEHDELVKRYIRNIEKVANENPKVFNDGPCSITFVKEDVYEPAIAEVGTDLGEHFAIFSEHVLLAVKYAHAQNRHVYVVIKRADGHKWLYSAQLFPFGDESTFPCVKCGRDVSNDGSGTFDCLHCHYIMRT